MAYRIESSVTISAPPAVVWSIIQDVSRRIEWDARVSSVELLTPLPIERGARTRIDYKMFGMPMQIEIEMITWQPPLKSAVRGVVLGTTDRVAGSWHFDENADGSTTWTTKLVLMSEGRFTWLREQLNGRMTRYLTIVSQQNLKRLVEGEYRGVASGQLQGAEEVATT